MAETPVPCLSSDDPWSGMSDEDSTSIEEVNDDHVPLLINEALGFIWNNMKISPNDECVLQLAKLLLHQETFNAKVAL